MKLVEHLLVKGISGKRAVKHVNRLIVLARTVGAPLRQLNKKDMEKINCTNESSSLRSRNMTST
jgi:hypothetical protein